jgi:hypothetical protein
MADVRDLTEVSRVRDLVADDQQSRDRLEVYVLRLLDEAREEVQKADSKTSIVFAAVTFLIGYLALVLFEDESAIHAGSHLATVLAAVALGAFLVALVLLALSVTPRLGEPAAGKARYFQELGQFPNAAAMLEVVAEDAVDPVVRHSQQLYTQSLIARRKYEHLRNSMYAVAVGLLLLGIAAVVSAFD